MEKIPKRVRNSSTRENQDVCVCVSTDKNTIFQDRVDIVEEDRGTGKSLARQRQKETRKELGKMQRKITS